MMLFRSCDILLYAITMPVFSYSDHAFYAIETLLQKQMMMKLITSTVLLMQRDQSMKWSERAVIAHQQNIILPKLLE